MRAGQGEPGTYLLAAAVFDTDTVDDARHAVATLAPGRHRKFHWRDEGVQRRAVAAGVVASLSALHFVTIGTPLDNGRQERCRRLCLCEILSELYLAGVTEVWMESRRPHQDRSDLRAVSGFRNQKRIGPSLRVGHALPAGPKGEPLLWVPDIVAGIVNGDHQGYRAALRPVLNEIHVSLS